MGGGGRKNGPRDTVVEASTSTTLPRRKSLEEESVRPRTCPDADFRAAFGPSRAFTTQVSAPPSTYHQQRNAPVSVIQQRLILLAVVAALGACADGPSTAPRANVDASALAELAATVSEDGVIRLPSLGALVAAARDHIRVHGASAEAVQHYRQAGQLRREAEAALAAGNPVEANRLRGLAEGRLLAAVLVTLGRSVATEATQATALGLRRIEGFLEGRDVPPALASAVARIAAGVALAQSRLEAGEPLAALRISLASAEAIRNLNPRYQAHTRIGAAAAALQQAVAAVQGTPSDAERDLLRASKALIDTAREMFGAQRYAVAFQLAQRAQGLAWTVMQGRQTP